jgi:type II secretory pathway component PulF
MDLFGCEEGVLTLPWFIVAAVLITGICIYVAVKHGMKATKILLRLVSFRRIKKRIAQK